MDFKMGFACHSGCKTVKCKNKIIPWPPNIVSMRNKKQNNEEEEIMALVGFVD
jgi:hypothetical protein